MADFREREKRRQMEIERFLNRLQQLVYNNYISILKIPGVQKAIQTGKDDFFFSHHHTANKELGKVLTELARQMDGALRREVGSAWKAGEENFLEKERSSYGDSAAIKSEIDIIQENAINAHLNRTAQTFYNENRDGLNISGRVWNLAKNSGKEMEIIIQNGIKEGKGADEIQRGIKDYLNHPEALFRRVRNVETGELEWSEAAKKYHPGQGVYRSAYKNAMRLARTEINAAYRQAEWESYQNNPLIVGFEIRLSNNHTTLKNGKKIELKDICDTLAGVYPKTFRWTGWHPQCRCLMLPIQISREELQERIRARSNGTLDQWKPKNMVTQPPKAFENWVKANIHRARGWTSIPRFIRDNPQFIDMKQQGSTIQSEVETRLGNSMAAAKKYAVMLQLMKAKYGGESKAIIHLIEEIFGKILDGQGMASIDALMDKLNHKIQVKEAWDNRIPKDTPHKAMKTTYSSGQEIVDTMKVINDELPDREKWFVRGVKSLGVEKRKYVNGSTNLYGDIWLKKERMELVKSAMGKIGQGKSKEITFDEADAMATYWHEITHNRNVPGKGVNGKAGIRYMEFANEFVARKTLPEFYTKLGTASTPHPEFIDNRDKTDYNTMVRPYDYVIKTLNLDATKVFNTVKDNLFTESYEKQRIGLAQGLIDGGIKKTDGTKVTKTEVNKLVEMCKDNIDRSGVYPDITNWLKLNGFTK